MSNFDLPSSSMHLRSGEVQEKSPFRLCMIITDAMTCGRQVGIHDEVDESKRSSETTDSPISQLNSLFQGGE